MQRAASLRALRHRAPILIAQAPKVVVRTHALKTAGSTDRAGASPVASAAMSAAPSSNRRCRSTRDEHGRAGGSPAATDRARAAEALHDAFTRLAPQGSDAWNFLAAFTHLGDRYGPYHPGASALSDCARRRAATDGAAGRGRSTGFVRAGTGRRAPAGGAADRARGGDGPRRRGLPLPVGPRRRRSRRRLAAEDRPVEGAAWLVPARALGSWAGPVAAHVLGAHRRAATSSMPTAARAISSARCGRGAPRRTAWSRAARWRCAPSSTAARSPSPRRPSTWRRGRTDRLGGIVLSGVVDRLPLHALLSAAGAVPAHARRGAPLVVVSEPVAATSARDAPALRTSSTAARSTRRPGSCCWTGPASSRWRRSTPTAGNDRRFALAAAAPS